MSTEYLEEKIWIPILQSLEINSHRRSGDPNQLLRDSTLNLLYLKAQVHNIVNDKALSDVECYALIGASIDAYHERGGKPLPFSE